MRGQQEPVVLAVAGASGQIYALQALKYLLQSEAIVELIISKGAYAVWREEMGMKIPAVTAQGEFWREQVGVPTAGKLICHHWQDIGAGIASGSYRTQGMVVMPCSMGTVAKLACGLSDDLLERTADVHLKEGRRLVIVPRETPFSLIHLRNLTTLAEVGVRIVPAIPAWYHQPQSVLDLVDFVVARALDQLDIDCVPLRRWR
ncbi:aromatic acid decarboxylase [Gloeomargarita lithophora Alchichica-D10]|uniref:Flavin prenyltransferase UbiX n=1 Tax=Gloeomargarita lithophora Alchichica-D10 TaxID=1188229 RepID=A0A1J0AB93_9CYAN|nr:flavin prenyltransferase UbiX [Gloeomargarita lithophora]APB33202.1 aromatic acid decarboxylase [Gloeomargarita lithophora Alchichica-D10]